MVPLVRLLLGGALLVFGAISLPVRADLACKVTPPDGWRPDKVEWEGECRMGTAEGLGVLTQQAGPQHNFYFFGRVKHGEPDVGVLETDEGYEAGVFRQGKLSPSDDRQVAINAFRVAAMAAQQAAERYRKRGKLGLARDFRKKARQLQEQMD